MVELDFGAARREVLAYDDEQADQAQQQAEAAKGKEYTEISVSDFEELAQAVGGCGDGDAIVGERLSDGGRG